MRVFPDLAALGAAVGQHLGHGPWQEVTQQQVDQFAQATGDDQWIHVDPERAAAGPFGGTIAHGYLTLSLISALARDVYRVENLRMGINYGLNKVRFPTPVRVGARVRAELELLAVTEVAQGSQVVMRCTVAIEGEPKPGCVAEIVVLLDP